MTMRAAIWKKRRRLAGPVIVLLSFAFTSLPGAAEEIKVIAAGATRAVLTSLDAAFTAKTGHTIVLVTDTAGGVAKRVEAGESAGLVISSRKQIDTLIDKGKLAPGSRADIASSVMAVAVRAGAPQPDISTLEGFRQMLLDAKTIAYVDPASGGTSGIYIAGVIDRMGLTEALRPKLRLQAGGYVAELVAKGEAEIAIHQMSEILPVKGVTLVGELPREIQSVTVYSAGLPADATGAARAYLAFITGREAAPAIEKAGLKPPPTP